MNAKNSAFILKIGKRVRQLRQDIDDNYIRFAEEKEVSKNTLFRIEQGKENYSIFSLINILEKFPGMTLEKFLKELIDADDIL